MEDLVLNKIIMTDNKIDVSLTNSGQVVLNNLKNKINEELFEIKLKEKYY